MPWFGPIKCCTAHASGDLVIVCAGSSHCTPWLAALVEGVGYILGHCAAASITWQHISSVVFIFCMQQTCGLGHPCCTALCMHYDTWACLASRVVSGAGITGYELQVVLVSIGTGS